ncbi:hypothetical protein GOODEAATRI_016529 [Goodea atripinnis]|uniref:Ankyrin repeat and SOCS box containing 3 n=1 Tax=Goodea atripinnis TaxID=208336 RepID=A0ABV0MU21_9TELE
MDFTECYEDTVSTVAAAARSGCRKRLRSLIQRGCSVDCRDNRGWNALHEAAAAGSKECRHDYVNSLTHEGESACYLAAQRGHLAVVRLLLKAHADLNQLTNDLSCPLYAGFPTNFSASVISSLSFTEVGLSAKVLMVKDQEGHQACVDLLLDHGADPNMACSNDWPQFPIHAAAEFGHVSDQTSSVELLLNEGYSPDAQDYADPLGFPSPLSMALYHTSTKPCRCVG